ncbi:hypothetical protein ACLOJK_001183 [Asimina triloba]
MPAKTRPFPIDEWYAFLPQQIKSRHSSLCTWCMPLKGKNSFEPVTDDRTPACMQIVIDGHLEIRQKAPI